MKNIQKFLINALIVVVTIMVIDRVPALRSLVYRVQK